MDLVIREATAGDYEALCQLIAEGDDLHREHLPGIFRRPPGPARDRQYIDDLLADETVAVLLAVVDGEPAGCVHLAVRQAPAIPIMVPRRMALVDDLVVKETFRRAGIGRALMERAEAWAAAHGAATLELNVFEFNQGAIEFYTGLGYETHSRRMRKATEA